MNVLQAASKKFPPDVLQLIASKAINPRCARFRQMLNLGPEALMSPFKQTGWEGILQADFGDLIARVRYDHLKNNQNIINDKISQIIVFEKQGSLKSVAFLPEGNFVSYNQPSERMVAILAILIHRFFPQLDISTIKRTGDKKWFDELKTMFPVPENKGGRKKPEQKKKKTRAKEKEHVRTP